MRWRICFGREQSEYVEAIRIVHRKAFGGSVEEQIVERLRESGALSVSLVGVVRAKIVGHIAFSPATVGGEALALAPLAVLSEYQRTRIGSAFVEQGLSECQRLGFELVIVVGDQSFTADLDPPG